jgi:HEAT repeat protein
MIENLQSSDDGSTRRSCLAPAWWVVCVMGLSLVGCTGPGPIAYMRDLVGPRRNEIARKVFDSEDADVRRETMVEMSKRPWGLSGATLRVYALVARTPSEEPTVRSVAIRALGRAGAEAEPYIDDILLALGDGVDDLRWDAAVALDSVVADAAVEGLCLRAVHDTSVDVRGACARALRHYRRTDAASALIDAMRDSDFAVRRQAHASLVEIVGRDLGPDASHWASVAKKIPPVEQAKVLGRRPWWDILGVTTSDDDATKASS